MKQSLENINEIISETFFLFRQINKLKAFGVEVSVITWLFLKDMIQIEILLLYLLMNNIALFYY
jgi:hypothetical protein